MSETALAKALRVLDDLPDAELIEVASVIEEDAKKALERRDRARGALLRRMHERNAKVLVDGDGVIAVELKPSRKYEWDGDRLHAALLGRERDKYLTWIDPTPGRWAPKSAVSINNLIDKLGDDPKAAQLAAARKVEESESIKFVGHD